MKKMLLQIGIYLGIFIVLNVGMFFLLKMTQPKSAVLDAALHGDSTAVQAEDSTSISEDQEFDEAPEMVEESGDASGEHVQADSGQHDESTEQAKVLASADGAKSDQKAEATESESSLSDLEAEHVDEEGTDSLAASEDDVVLSETPKSTAEISKLAKLLEGMKPNEAAVIAERLPTETIVQLVMRMKSRNGAKMMASLPVPVAASVATRMAELSGVKSPS